LSNCHTGTLVAPDGLIDWLCVPRFDAPSVFDSLLDRQINHPTTRIYERRTNVLVTTWKSPSGWILAVPQATRFVSQVLKQTDRPCARLKAAQIVRTFSASSGPLTTFLLTLA
jgi:GH15 family glucan-1,4-alpha-glucosidase